MGIRGPWTAPAQYGIMQGGACKVPSCGLRPFTKDRYGHKGALDPSKSPLRAARRPGRALQS